jgi:hypothetical protein
MVAHLQLELGHVAGIHAVVAAVVRARGAISLTTSAPSSSTKTPRTARPHTAGRLRWTGSRPRPAPHAGWRQVLPVNLGHGQDAVAVQVALRRQVDHPCPSAPRATMTEHSAASGSIFSSTQGTLLARRPRRRPAHASFHAGLALAVVTQPRGLEDAGQQVRPAPHASCAGFDHRIGSTGHAATREVGFFQGAVLRNRHRVARRAPPGVRGQRPQRAAPARFRTRW